MLQSQLGLHVLRGLARHRRDLPAAAACLARVFRNRRQMALVQGAQVLHVLSKGEGVVAPGGDFVAEFHPFAGHPVYRASQRQHGLTCGTFILYTYVGWISGEEI